MNFFKRISIPIVLIFVVAGCMQLGINFKHKTPHKASKLPAFTSKDSLIGFNGEKRSCFDVKHYEVNLEIIPGDKTVSGYVATTFALLKYSPQIQLDLDPHLIVDSVVQDRAHLKFSRKGTGIFIDLLRQNNLQKVMVYYHGKPVIARRPPWDGGFVWKKDKNKKTFAGVACEGEGAHLWLPVKTYLGDEPDSVDTYFTVPADLVAVSNGKLVTEVANGNKKTFHYKTSYPINPYNITFYLGDFKKIETSYTSVSGVKFNREYYVLLYNFDRAEKHFEQSSSILKIYEQVFGEYPWPKDGYKLVESPYAGMEHQTAIAYGNGYKNTPGQNFDYIVLHETAHEWWGNSVSVADFADVWLHEGFATYAEALYVEKTKGYKEYLRYINWNSVMVMNKKPVIGPTGLYYWNYKDGDPYTKGSATLHSLRNHLNNDSLFFKIIKTFYKKYTYGTANTEDFILLVNEMSGKDLGYFFRQYLYRRDAPYLQWNLDFDAELGKDQLVYKFADVNQDFTTAIEVKQGEHTFKIYPSDSVQFYTLPEPATVEVKMNTKLTYLRNGFEKQPKIKSKKRRK